MDFLQKAIELVNEQIIWVREEIISDKNSQNCPLKRKNKTDNNLQWTGTQIEFVELVYSIHDAKSINNGNISIKELFSTLSVIFNFQVTNYYQYFSDITRRTGDRTIYLDKLKKMFLQHLSKSDTH